MLTRRRMQLHLFVNDVHVNVDTQAADLVEATFDGYVPRVVDQHEWTIKGDTAAADEAVFTSAANQKLERVYGWYLTDWDTDALIGAERFDAKMDMTNNGDTIRVTPSIEVPDVETI